MLTNYSQILFFADADSNPKTNAIPYAVATGGSNVDPGAAARVQKVNNVTGSCAGAGSGEFHTYRKSRRSEEERVVNMTVSQKEMILEQAYQERIALHRVEADSKTAKNAAKRRKRKERLLAKRQKTTGGDDGSSGSADSDDEDEDARQEEGSGRSGSGSERPPEGQPQDSQAEGKAEAAQEPAEGPTPQPDTAAAVSSQPAATAALASATAASRPPAAGAGVSFLEKFLAQQAAASAGRLTGLHGGLNRTYDDNDL